jgi:methyltransferase (TIGR00027 family)
MLEQDRPASFTAIGVAILRAIHQLHDGQPRILDDAVAVPLLRPKTMRWAEANIARYQTPGMRALRSHVVLRSRYAEDCLCQAVSRGVRQFVLLGAGLDTFAYRQPEWAAHLRIFEVDHSGSQQAKIEHLKEAGILIPSNVEFVPADFERQSIRQVMEHSHFDFSAPAVFACLGVLVYLDEASIEAIFRFVVSLSRGTELIFTFSPKNPDAANQFGDESKLAEKVAALGEPMRTHHDPSALRQQLLKYGFSEVSFLEPEESHRLYFENRSDDLPAPRHSSIARAIV